MCELFPCLPTFVGVPENGTSNNERQRTSCALNVASLFLGRWGCLCLTEKGRPKHEQVDSRMLLVDLLCVVHLAGAGCLHMAQGCYLNIGQNAHPRLQAFRERSENERPQKKCKYRLVGTIARLCAILKLSGSLQCYDANNAIMPPLFWILESLSFFQPRAPKPSNPSPTPPI